MADRVEHDRGLGTCGAAMQELHVFGSFGDPTVAGDLPEWADYTGLIQTSWTAQSSAPRLWLVHGRGWSKQRLAQGDLNPLSRAEVQQRDGSWSPRPIAKLGIRIGGMGTGKQPIVIDADQSLELYASALDVGIVTPAGWQDVDDPTVSSPVVAGGDLAIDDLVGVRIVGIQAPVGARDAVLTTTIVAPDASGAEVPVPRGAYEVLISPATAGAPGAWEWRVGSPAALTNSTIVGTFVPNNIPVRVPSASHLAVTSAGGPRVFTAAWKIRA